MDEITSKRIGRLMAQLRFKDVREKGTGQRMWSFTPAEVQRWMVRYGLGVGADISDVSDTGTQDINVTNVTNVTNDIEEEDDFDFPDYDGEDQEAEEVIAGADDDNGIPF